MAEVFYLNKLALKQRLYWFQTFAVCWMSCCVFWVISRRLNFWCRRFGTFYPFHLHRRRAYNFYAYEGGTDRKFRNVGTKSSDAGRLPKKHNTTTFIFLWEIIFCFKSYVFCEILWQLYRTSTHEDFNVKINRLVTINLMCLSATSPSAASLRRWLKHWCQVACSLPTHYATSVPCTLAQHYY